MLLAIDVGNSSIAIGAFRLVDAQMPEMICHFKFGMHSYTADELCAMIDSFLLRFGVTAIDGAVVASVVPQMNAAVCSAAKTCAVNLKWQIIAAFHMRIKNLEQLGADIVSNATVALILAQAPIALLDMGTATTLTVIDAEKTLLGTIIILGLQTSLSALSVSAAQLGEIPLDSHPELIRRDTRASISSGVLNGMRS